MPLRTGTLQTPLGTLHIAVRGDTLCTVAFDEHWPQARPHLERRLGESTKDREDDPAGLVTRFRRYFDGDLHALDDVETDPGGTPFQKVVWSALRRIPIGTTVSYQDLARAIGQPTAVRAVGAANGRNPIPIVIPCHRVIGADGTLTGYAGGLDRKRWLLEHEGAVRAPNRLPGI